VFELAAMQQQHGLLPELRHRGDGAEYVPTAVLHRLSMQPMDELRRD
jgi:hypothetical protein